MTPPKPQIDHRLEGAANDSDRTVLKTHWHQTHTLFLAGVILAVVGYQYFGSPPVYIFECSPLRRGNWHPTCCE